MVAASHRQLTRRDFSRVGGTRDGSQEPCDGGLVLAKMLGIGLGRCERLNESQHSRRRWHSDTY